MFCTQCGAHLDDDAKFCTECGAPVGEKDQGAPEPASASATVVSAPAQPASVPAPVTQPASAPQPEPAAPRRRVPAALVVAAALALVAVGVLGGLYAASAGPFASAPATTPAPSADGQPQQDGDGAASGEEPSSPVEDAKPQTISVPALTGVAKEDALAGLEDGGFGIGEVTYEPSDSVAEGAVLSTDPAAGTAVEPETAIDLVVSSGPAPTRVEHRYTLVKEAMTWDDAQAYCEAHGGYLATITSADEYAQVLALMPDSADTAICWVGGQRADNAWRWVTGEDFSFDSWASGEPNNDGGTEDKLVLLRTPELAWGWYDVPNDVSAYYKPYRMGFVMEQEVEVS